MLLLLLQFWAKCFSEPIQSSESECPRPHWVVPGIELLPEFGIGLLPEFGIEELLQEIGIGKLFDIELTPGIERGSGRNSFQKYPLGTGKDWGSRNGSLPGWRGYNFF